MTSGSICFRVVKEPYGWAVRMGEGMMTPFSSQVGAIEHANEFAEALRRCGELAEVIVEETAPPEPPPPRSRRRRRAPVDLRRMS